MDLVLKSNNFEKKNRELAFAAACSSTQCFLKQAHIRGGADKSLDRLTSQCRRTESIVLLERGVC